MSPVEFNTLLTENVSFLKPFATTFTKDEELAKDLYQETLFRALNHQDKFQVNTNIRAWLFTIMRNLFINQHRKKLKHPILSGSDALEFIHRKGHATPSTQLYVKEIHNAIHHLPPIFKIPMVLYTEGYKYIEIADLLQEPIGTIKSRIHFARKILKSKLPR